MVFENFFDGQSLPFYISILLLAAYFIWSKFLNKGNLRIGWKVDNVLDILIIFVAILSTIGGFYILLSSLTGIFNLSFNLPDIAKSLPSILEILGVVLVILFIFAYRNKKANKKELKKIFDKIKSIFYLVGIVILTFYFLALLTNMRYIFWDQSIIAIVTIAIFILLTWSLVDAALFGVQSKHYFDKKSKKTIFIAIIIGILVLLLLTPIVLDGEKKVVGYKVYDIGKRHNESYSIVETTTKIITPGVLASIVPIIPINYGKNNYELDTNIEGSNFKVFVKKKNEAKKKSIFT